MNIFLACGLIFVLALGTSKLLGRLKFPAVTSYLLLGILIGPYGLKLIPENLVNAVDFIGYFVLGMVAFSLGENFLWREFRRVGREVIIISIAAVIGVLVFVSLALLSIGQSVSTAIIFGAVATATAPMATIMVIRECRAKGSFTNILLEVVAVDDAWGIIVFAIAVAIAKIISFPVIGNPFAKAMIVVGGGNILGSDFRVNPWGFIIYFSAVFKNSNGVTYLQRGLHLNCYRNKFKTELLTSHVQYGHGCSSDKSDQKTPLL